MLTVHNLSRHFGSHVAVDQFNLEIREGEFVTLLGPSGSGKSTVLRMIAGLLEPTSGTVHIAGRDVTRLPPQARGIGLVFQSYALFPHMTAAENIAFPLKVRRWSREQVRRRVDEMLELVGLAHRRDHLPEQLSGGERQRVALARSLAFRPPLLLLDEPLSALDAKVRVSLRESLKQIQATTGVTTLMVTHDQEEALELADRVAVMNQGRIEQVGTPAEIYYNPATAFTAQFIGSVTALTATVVSVRETGDEAGRVATLEWAGSQFEWRVTDG
ncbi:MAG: ABC transporter ATP-binding protein, partial [Alicyclobacillus sp.]|nr:ABC transporter ATP-binding protein [Alicyclobacillus sp.]